MWGRGVSDRKLNSERKRQNIEMKQLAVLIQSLPVTSSLQDSHNFDAMVSERVMARGNASYTRTSNLGNNIIITQHT